MITTRKPKGPYLPKQVVNGTKVSGQEYQVFRLIGKGLCSEEIAAQLGMSVDRVGDVKHSLKKKLGCRHHVELASIATREQVKQETKDGDFLRDDLLAMWLSHDLEDVSVVYLLDRILEFRLLDPEEVKERIGKN